MPVKKPEKKAPKKKPSLNVHKEEHRKAPMSAGVAQPMDKASPKLYE